MAEVNYTRIQSRAISALERAGQSCVLRQLGTESGNEWDPTFGPPILTDCKGITYRPRLENREGSLIDAEYLRAMIRPQTGLVISQDDRLAVGIAAADVVADTKFYEIMDVQEFAPGGVVIYWELELRK